MMSGSCPCRRLSSPGAEQQQTLSAARLARTRSAQSPSVPSSRRRHHAFRGCWSPRSCVNRPRRSSPKAGCGSRPRRISPYGPPLDARPPRSAAHSRYGEQATCDILKAELDGLGEPMPTNGCTFACHATAAVFAKQPKGDVPGACRGTNSNKSVPQSLPPYILA